MKVKIEEIPSCRIAFIRQAGPYGSTNAQAMEQLKKWAGSNHLLNDQSIIFGIAHDDPSTTKPHNCRYDTCLVVPDNDAFHDDFIHDGNISGGKYAVFQIEHTAEAVKRAWAEIFPALSNQGYRFDQSRPILERYIPAMIRRHYCEICIPVY